MLQRSKRIHGRLIVAQILKKGHEIPGSFFVVRSLKGLKPQTRYAALVGKKLAPLASTRNHKRRQIYTAIRELQSEKALSQTQIFDIIILARKPALEASYAKIKAALKDQLNALDQIQLQKNPSPAPEQTLN